MPNPIFARDSFWTTPLPDDAPLDPHSGKIVADLVKTAAAQFGELGRPHVSVATDSYTPTVYVTTDADPIATFVWEDCMDLKTDSGLIDGQLSGIRVPREARPSPGSDGHMSLYNADTDVYTDLWRARRIDDSTWSVCWGGTIRQASTSDGRFSHPFGANAIGVAMMGGVIRAEELARGRIDHVLGICLPYAKPPTVLSWPATRGDGLNPLGLNVPAQGQRFRLPASLDIASMKLSPTASLIARAAQQYGIIVWDTSSAVHFRAINSVALPHNPYPELFRYRYSAAEFLGDATNGEAQFPLDELQLLAIDYGQDEARRAASRPEGSRGFGVVNFLIALVAGLSGLAVGLGILGRAARNE